MGLGLICTTVQTVQIDKELRLVYKATVDVRMIQSHQKLTEKKGTTISGNVVAIYIIISCILIFLIPCLANLPDPACIQLYIKGANALAAREVFLKKKVKLKLLTIICIDIICEIGIQDHNFFIKYIWFSRSINLIVNYLSLYNI